MTERCGHDHSSSVKDDHIFDSNSLQSILKHYSIKDNKLHGNIYNGKYLIRPLSISDYDHGYIDLLRQLTDCGQINYAEFQQRFYQMKQCLNTYYILVLEDINFNQQIIGTATLICEKKFLRQLGIRARIEDVVVDHRYRGQQLGKLLVDLLTKFAREECACYKISLECKDELVQFYKRFGYDHEDKQNYLCQRFQKNKNVAESSQKLQERISFISDLINSQTAGLNNIMKPYSSIGTNANTNPYPIYNQYRINTNPSPYHGYSLNYSAVNNVMELPSSSPTNPNPPHTDHQYLVELDTLFDDVFS